MTIDAKVESSWRLSETRGARSGGTSAHRISIAPGAFPHEQTPPSGSQFLIANARLEFRVSHSKQRPGPSSNRERIAIFQHDFSGPLPHHLEFLIGTFANSKFRSTRCKRTSKQIYNRYKNPFPTLAVVRENGIYSLLPCTHASPPPCIRVFLASSVAATRRPRYNSGSHTEVNQL
jgi:hypothetical protein